MLSKRRLSMKKVDKRKVQVRLAPHSKDYKIVQYRIDPSELNWFQRLFNVWGVVEYFYSPLVFRPNMDLLICWGRHLTKIGTIPPDVLGMIGSSVALSISDIPFAGPTGSVVVG